MHAESAEYNHIRHPVVSVAMTWTGMEHPFGTTQAVHGYRSYLMVPWFLHDNLG